MMSKPVIAALRGIEDEGGRIAPADVVAAARAPESPLHGFFEWDDSEAAHRYRLDQARSLIRRVVVEVVVRDVSITVPAYIRDPEAEAHAAGYRQTQAVRRDADVARAALVEEMKRVSSAVRRAKALAAVLGVAEDIEAIETMAAGVSRRVQEAHLS